MQPIKCPSAIVDDNISHDPNIDGNSAALLMASIKVTKVTKVMSRVNHTPTATNKDCLDVNSNEFVLNLSTGKRRGGEQNDRKVRLTNFDAAITRDASG